MALAEGLAAMSLNPLRTGLRRNVVGCLRQILSSCWPSDSVVRAATGPRMDTT